jgi:hypothetical protein
VAQLGILIWGRLKILIYEIRVAREEDMAGMEIFSTLKVQHLSGKAQNHDVSPLRYPHLRQRPSRLTVLLN